MEKKRTLRQVAQFIVARRQLQLQQGPPIKGPWMVYDPRLRPFMDASEVAGKLETQQPYSYSPYEFRAKHSKLFKKEKV